METNEEIMALLADSLIPAGDKAAATPALEPYRIEDWDISRFRGEPPPMKFLLEDLFPLGIAGTFYSPGGTGKSTLALDLAIRVAIADAYPTKWVGTFNVLEGGSVLYLSCEEPDDVLHHRFSKLLKVIAEDAGFSTDTILKCLQGRLYVANLWGRANPLFKVVHHDLIVTPEYPRILQAAHEVCKGAPLKLVVMDTRGRMSGAEGAGNGPVGREVALIEKIAYETKASVLVLTHTSKASYSGTMPANQAVRGESAYLDSLRFGLLIQVPSQEDAKALGLTEEERTKHFILTNSKQNYTALKAPLLLRREDYRFSPVESKIVPTPMEKKALKSQADILQLKKIIADNPGISQNGLFNQAKISPRRCLTALEEAENQGAIRVERGPRSAKQYWVSGSTEVDP